MIRDEIQHVALGMQVNYEGVFNLQDMLQFIDSFFKKKGYEKHVMGHKETVQKGGRTFSMRLRPFKPVKQNKLEVQVWINISDLKDVKKEVDGVEITLNQGKVNIVIDCFVLYNIRGGWDARPEYVLIKTIFDKFLFSSGGKDYEGMVQSDATELRNELNSFLNLNKFLF